MQGASGSPQHCQTLPLSSVLPFCHCWCGWHREPPHTLCTDQVSITLVFGRASPSSLKVLITPFLCSCALCVLGVCTVPPLCPSVLPPTPSPAASCGRRALELGLQVSRLCAGRAVHPCCPGRGPCFTVVARRLHLRFTVAAALHSKVWAGPWSFLVTVWVW